MIRLSNGHVLEYVVASGALAFDGMGWPWERPLVALGLIKPELFTVFIKSLTLLPREGNLRWYKPWECVRLIPGGSVNKVGLTNPGIDWWCEKVAPAIDFRRYSIAGSVFGTKEETVAMTKKLNPYPLVALEVNASCPNTGHAKEKSQIVIDCVKAVADSSNVPVVVKLGADQEFLEIASALKGIAQAVSLNSVPWNMVFSGGERTPLWKLEERVKGGSGGVSGKPAQRHNWDAVRQLSRYGSIPVIGPSVMEFEDMSEVRARGAQAVSFGAIHIRTPWKPTSLVLKEMKINKGKESHVVTR